MANNRIPTHSSVHTLIGYVYCMGMLMGCFLPLRPGLSLGFGVVFVALAPAVVRGFSRISAHLAEYLPATVRGKLVGVVSAGAIMDCMLKTPGDLRRHFAGTLFAGMLNSVRAICIGLILMVVILAVTNLASGSGVSEVLGMGWNLVPLLCGAGTVVAIIRIVSLWHPSWTTAMEQHANIAAAHLLKRPLQEEVLLGRRPVGVKES